MTTETPLRHRGEDDALVRALHAAYEDGPSEAELRALEAGVLGAIQGGGGGGAPPAPPKSAPWTTVLASVAGAGALAGLVALGLSAMQTPEVTPRGVAPLVEAPSAPVVVEPPLAVIVPEEAPPPVENSPVRARRPRVEALAVEAPEEASVEAPPVETEDEIVLLRRATSALTNRPAEALQLTTRMARVAQPEWAEERERVAIEALVRLERRPEAEARFTRFQSTYPSSAYAPRLRVVLGQ